jgi:hypothetical protein
MLDFRMAELIFYAAAGAPAIALEGDGIGTSFSMSAIRVILDRPD